MFLSCNVWQVKLIMEYTYPFIWLRFFVQNILVTWLWVSFHLAASCILYHFDLSSIQLTENTFFQEQNCALMIVQYDWGNGDIGSRWHFLWLDIFFGREIGVNTILEWMPISPLLDFISPTRHLEICLLFFTRGTEQKSYRGFVLIFQIVICSLFQITFPRSFRGDAGPEQCIRKIIRLGL